MSSTCSEFGPSTLLLASKKLRPTSVLRMLSSAFEPIACRRNEKGWRRAETGRSRRAAVGIEFRCKPGATAEAARYASNANSKASASEGKRSQYSWSAGFSPCCLRSAASHATSSNLNSGVRKEEGSFSIYDWARFRSPRSQSDRWILVRGQIRSRFHGGPSNLTDGVGQQCEPGELRLQSRPTPSHDCSRRIADRHAVRVRIE